MRRPIEEAARFIEQCSEALGGKDSLHGVTSFYSQSERCLWMADQEPRTLRVDLYRAVGGRIRIEELDDQAHLTVTVVNGLSGARIIGLKKGEEFIIEEKMELDALEVQGIKRGVRLFPRNFLAHADEHQYDFSGIQQFSNQQVYVITLPAEAVTYHFDTENLTCVKMIDRRNDTVITYEDYRNIEGVITPFVERAVRSERNFQVDTIKTVEYNQVLEDDLFRI
jgi:hypothetical protein